MVFSRVGPNQSIEWGQFRVSKSDALKTEAGKAVYKMRKQIVEPVFGYIKEGRGFRRFSFRGSGNVRSEWRLICATHNLLKLFRSGWKMQPLSS